MISFISFINMLPSPGSFSSVLSDVKILEDDFGAITLVFSQFFCKIGCMLHLPQIL